MQLIRSLIFNIFLYVGLITIFILASMGTSVAFAATAGELLNLKMILSAPAIFSLITFVIAY